MKTTNLKYFFKPVNPAARAIPKIDDSFFSALEDNYYLIYLHSNKVAAQIYGEEIILFIDKQSRAIYLFSSDDDFNIITMMNFTSNSPSLKDIVRKFLNTHNSKLEISAAQNFLKSYNQVVKERYSPGNEFEKMINLLYKEGQSYSVKDKISKKIKSGRPGSKTKI